MNNSFISTGIEQRIDQKYQFENNWSNISNDIVGYADISTNSKHGWNKDLTYKKRIKSTQVNQNLNYSLLDLTLSWRKQKSPFTCFIDLKKKKRYLKTEL